MLAVAYDSFGGPLAVRELPDPEPEPGDVLVRVRATGICRSDWHGWMGHDPDIRDFPHVPGHELAGEVAALGRGVNGFQVGQRVTVPFVAGCGRCEPCRAGDPQVCEAQAQPGFTHWGSFAELVRIRYADGNLVALPDDVDYVTAASLGCRFTTSYRAVVSQGRAAAGEWVAVHGCGGVGLSAVMIARSLGASVVAVDLNPEALALATSVGAVATVRAGEGVDVVAAVVDATQGGPHLSIDALGSADILHASVSSLRTRGRHVQVGLLVEDQRDSKVPMARVVAKELEVLGSHGMQAAQFPPLFELMRSGALDPRRLVTRTCTLEEGAAHLAAMDREPHAGVTVIDRLESGGNR